jgi:hypothetical protein
VDVKDTARSVVVFVRLSSSNACLDRSLAIRDGRQSTIRATAEKSAVLRRAGRLRAQQRRANFQGTVHMTLCSQSVRERRTL